MKTHYDQIWNICVGFLKSLYFSNLENFGDSWGENDASWKVDHENQFCLKYHFWQLFFQSKHSMIKSEIFLSIRFIFSLNFFESEIFWRHLEGERCILHGWSWISILFRITFLTTFILIIKLYNSIIELLGENIKKKSWFFSVSLLFWKIYLVCHCSRKIVKV